MVVHDFDVVVVRTYHDFPKISGNYTHAQTWIPGPFFLGRSGPGYEANLIQARTVL